MRPVREWIHTLFNGIGPDMRVLFRTDAGRISGLSFGHVSRCMILAGVLKDIYRSEILFLMRRYDEGTGFAGESGWNVKTMPVEMTTLEEGEIVTRTVTEFRPDWLVVDLPYDNLDLSCFSSLRREGIKVLFIDDARFMTPNVDVVLNSSLSAIKRTKKMEGDGTRYLLGPDYFIFDESRLAEAQTDAGPGNGAHTNVLITFGGSDPTDLTRKVFEAIKRRVWDGVSFSIILGPGYPNAEQTASLFNRERNVHVFVNPPGIIPLLQACDLAVCAGGRTLYELLYLRKRFIPIASAPHEAEVVEEATREGLITGGLAQWDEDAFISVLDSMITNPT